MVYEKIPTNNWVGFHPHHIPNKQPGAFFIAQASAKAHSITNPKQCTTIMEILQNYHKFASSLIPLNKVPFNLMIPNQGTYSTGPSSSSSLELPLSSSLDSWKVGEKPNLEDVPQQDRPQPQNQPVISRVTGTPLISG